LNWNNEFGRSLVAEIDALRKENVPWRKITMDLNKKHGLNFHREKYRKAWRTNHRRQNLSTVVEQNAVNELSISADPSSLITSVDDLIRETRIDTNVWIKDKVKEKAWTSPLPKGQGAVQMYSISADFIKRIPDEQLFPPLNPVSIQQPVKQTPAAVSAPMKKAVIVPDTQIGFKRDMISGKLTPFHNRIAMDLVLSIIEDIKPDKVFLLGDNLDLPDWSDKFLRSPELYFTTQPSLIELSWFLARIRGAVPSAEIIYLEGNHEARMRKAIINNLLAAHGLKSATNLKGDDIVSIPTFLDLPSIDVEFISGYPHAKSWVNSDLMVRHGNIARKKSGATVSAILDETQVSQIVGHVHRFELAAKTVYDYQGERQIVVFSPGCLALVDGEIPRGQDWVNWQDGTGVVYYSDDFFSIVPILISGGQAVFNGTLYKGIDYTEKLFDETSFDAYLK